MINCKSRSYYKKNRHIARCTSWLLEGLQDKSARGRPTDLWIGDGAVSLPRPHGVAGRRRSLPFRCTWTLRLLPLTLLRQGVGHCARKSFFDKAVHVKLHIVDL